MNLLLAARKRFVAGPEFLTVEKETLEYVNYHLLTVEADKYLLSGPQAFAVLEGTLRRKNSGYVTNDGTIHRPFCVVSSGQQTKHASGGRLNRIDDSLRLFEQVVTNDRGRPCSALGFLRDEIAGLYASAMDMYNLIDSWRNDLVHGKEYWQNTVPVILNMICLLAIDEVEPSVYDGRTAEIRQGLQWRRQIGAGAHFRAPWDMFPPDLNH